MNGVTPARELDHHAGLFDVVGHPTVANWLEYNAAAGGYHVTLERDDNSVDRVSGPPKLYRYELQGPAAGRSRRR